MKTTHTFARGLSHALFMLAGMAIAPATQAQTQVSQPTTTEVAAQEARMGWWRDAKFGMFIHWGLYSVPAGAWPGKGTTHAEWIRDTAQIPVAEYEKLLAQFNPVKFNADEFARIAQDAGMRYLVITSKHHDGFCLFDSKETDWDVMSTPFKRDIMKELSDACHKLGTAKPGDKIKAGTQPVRFCMYHSIMDWHHPDYLPRRPWERANRPDAGADFEKFVKYLKAELAEITAPKYDPGLIWFDGEWEGTWTHERGADLAKYMRTIAPNVIVNNRIDKGRAGMDGETKGADFLGDYHTPEQTIPERGLPGDWETCMTMNGNWGYNAADRDFKTSEDLIKKLCDISSKGGNFLLNVGPTALGEIPPDSVRRLHQIGEWMRVNGDAIYGTVRSPLPTPPTWGRVTMKQTTGGAMLYLMVFDPPKDGKLVVSGLLNEPGRVWLMQSDKSSVRTELKAHAAGGQIEIDISRIGAGALTGTSPVAVYALEIKGEPDPTSPPTINAFADTFVDSVEVSFACERKGVEIRMTSDGTDPTATSPLAAPVKVSSTTSIAARCFRDGKVVSPTVKRSFTKVPARASVVLDKVAQGLTLECFEGDWDKLPDFKSLKPTKTQIATEIGIAGATRPEYYGLRYTGFFKVDQNGVYVISLASDDGSKLYVGTSLLVDNDGLHSLAEKHGTIALAAGWHPITVEMFEKAGGADLQVTIAGPSMTKQKLTGTRLGHSEK